MKFLTGHEIKNIWLKFFEERGHKVEEGASLVPINDPTLLWINAGVAPLKGYFDGSKIPENPRIVNAQKCIRTNDIENVGKTARHHTFFEMLGNFSIGDYFRDEAIPWAYELLTSEEYYGFDPNKLYYTVYPTDQDTKKAWMALGIKEDRIIESEHNFWEIGSGPCGPCTEIFYDRGSAFGEGDISLIRDDIENDRYIEVWNIVFSQFNSKEHLSRDEYPELPSKNIDTGMGLERMACVIQNKDTNFETDLFFPIIKHISRIAHVPYQGDMSFKVIADHIRTVTFAISDGATFSNEGRGYVLRRLLRRAVKHGRSLGIDRPFLKELVETVVNMMEESYPYLKKTEFFVKQVVEKEELKFLETLHQGEKMLENLLKKNPTMLEGKDAFMLYDTYGFPVELTEEYAENQGIKVDKEGFLKEMQAQKERARSARKQNQSMKDQNEAFMNFKLPSTFVGYDTLETASEIIKVFKEGIVTKETPFYAESGGQVSDQGVIMHEGNSYEVLDVEKLPNGQTLHVVEGDFTEGDIVTLKVDEVTRKTTMAHHSVTHLLFLALREILGSHVSQQGSMVGPEHLRFDFNHFSLPTDQELLQIEESVNQRIKEHIPVVIEYGTLEEAKQRGAIAEFGEKYQAEVRMVSMGDTLDLCGGTHVSNSRDIEHFAIAGVESKGSGIYRITALAKDRIYAMDEYLEGFNELKETLYHKADMILEEAAQAGFDLTFTKPALPKIKGSYQDVLNKREYTAKLGQQVKELDKKLQDLKEKASLKDLETYLKERKNDTIIIKTDNIAMNALKTLVDRLMDHLQKGVVFVANISGDKLILIAKSTTDVHAGKLVKEAAQKAGGNGGGRADFAQAGAKDISKVDEVLAYVKEVLT